ncbi:MAG TPA: PD-(D/E)XK nuclease family protein [Gammaproteobacteria bacterium]
MLEDLLSRLTDGAEVVTGSGLKARQLQTALTDEILAPGSVDATTARVESYSAWMTALWQKLAPGDRQLLTRGQSLALWRRTVTESDAAQGLIGCDSAAGWAADAWQRLWSHEIDPLRLSAVENDTDFAVFLGWARRYRETLDSNGWIDGELAAAELLTIPSLEAGAGRSVIWADIDDMTPAQRALSARLERAGWGVSQWEMPGTPARSRRIELSDQTTELAIAARWAAAKLAANARQRLALIVPGADSSAYELDRLLNRQLDTAAISLTSISRQSYFDPRGQPALRQPAIGAAFNALELMSHRGSFVELSRWLRSPFFAADPDDDLDRAMLEKKLRAGVAAQLGFRGAFQNAGLAQSMRDSFAGTERRLRRALKLLTGDRALEYATPTRWAGIWQQILTELAWTGGQAGAARAAAAAWDAALNEFCLLTPVVGRLSLGDALAEFERIIAEPRAGGPIPAFGLTLLKRPEDLVAGYHAVWITGMADSQWPRMESPNPLLPLRLQYEHSMAGSSPAETLSRARRVIESLPRRTRDLTVSSCGVLDESPASPSPLIAGFPVAPPPATDPAPLRLPTCRREQRDDVAPPLPGKEISGGAYTLTQQSRSPLRAFLESRLGARPLEAVRRGLSTRQRGIITHETMERFLHHLPSRDDLAQWDPAERRAFAESCASKALANAFRGAEKELAVIVDLERERIVRLLEMLIDRDLARPGFRIEAVETSEEIEIAGYRLNCRIDRIDSLDDGGKAVIDLKTGRRATPSDWLGERLRDAQLPLYAQAFGSGVTALVLAVATSDGMTFKGLWSPREAFPGRAGRLPGDREWPQQLAVWTQQVETLVREYVDGDVRILIGNETEVAGNLAPLSRLYEQVALAEGWLAPWSTS